MSDNEPRENYDRQGVGPLPEGSARGPTPSEEGRHDHRYHYGSVWVGVAFILLGVIFILQTLHAVALNNWWALFILIPAVGSFAGAMRNFQRNGKRFTRSVSGSIGGGLFFTAVALLFLFEADWGRWWPIFIVLCGVSILLGAFARRVR